MGTGTDAGLALLVLAATGIAYALVGAPVSPLALAVGGLGTVGFELVAARDPETVRDYWERPVVQAVSVALALVGVVAGAVVAPSVVLSFALGALVMYLVVLLFLRLGWLAFSDLSF